MDGGMSRVEPQSRVWKGKKTRSILDPENPYGTVQGGKDGSPFPSPDFAD